jgi:hypothetical protein
MGDVLHSTLCIDIALHTAHQHRTSSTLHTHRTAHCTSHCALRIDIAHSPHSTLCIDIALHTAHQHRTSSTLHTHRTAHCTSHCALRIDIAQCTCTPHIDVSHRTAHPTTPDQPDRNAHCTPRSTLHAAHLIIKTHCTAHLDLRSTLNGTVCIAHPSAKAKGT